MPRKGAGTKRGYHAHGWVVASTFKFVFVELVRRLGVEETRRRIDISQRNLYNIVNGRNKYIQRETLRKAIIVLANARAIDEARHRDSIKHGAYLRGREEKKPIRISDFYVASSDADNAKRWVPNTEEQKQKQRQKWKESKQRQKERRKPASDTT